MEGRITALTLIVVLGISAQWLAWRLRLPSILFLLVAGFLAGPVTGLIATREVFGDLLQPLVSLSVALILFEGGLTLRVHELRGAGAVVRNLVTIGALVTWAVAATAARLFLFTEARLPECDRLLELSILLGAILIVTGPTVIIPLLRHVRPKGQSESILRWEGIVIDPIGATVAVLVFEAIVALPGGRFDTGASLLQFLETVGIGGGLGAAGAGILYVLLKRYLIPDALQSPCSLMLAVAVFGASNHLQEESGLFAVTVMGIGLANQRSVPIRHIIEFKENLGILLISALFIILAADLDWTLLEYAGADAACFLAALILVARPASVFLSTIRKSITLREKLFLCMMAPRGIVAAAVASVFALRLAGEGVAAAELLVPFTFLVIVGTVTFYGLGAPLAARWLGLAESNPQGILFIGAHRWAAAMAKALHDRGVEVLLADSNHGHAREARMAGLPVYHGNVLSEDAHEKMSLQGLGRVLAMTPNDEVNALAALHFREFFGRGKLYQLAPDNVQKDASSVPKHLRGRYAFADKATFDEFELRWALGARIAATKITEEFGFDDFETLYGDRALPLFLCTEKGEVVIVTREEVTAPKPGQTLISLVDEGGGEERAVSDARPEER